MFIRPPLLPEDMRYIGIAPETLRSSVPGLARWLSKVFTVLGGFMSGCGVLVSYFAVRVRRRAPVVAAGDPHLGLLHLLSFAFLRRVHAAVEGLARAVSRPETASIGPDRTLSLCASPAIHRVRRHHVRLPSAVAHAVDTGDVSGAGADVRPLDCQ